MLVKDLYWIDIDDLDKIELTFVKNFILFSHLHVLTFGHFHCAGLSQPTFLHLEPGWGTGGGMFEWQRVNFRSGNSDGKNELHSGPSPTCVECPMSLFTSKPASSHLALEAVLTVPLLKPRMGVPSGERHLMKSDRYPRGLRPDVAILATARQGNVDGEPIQEYLAQFIAPEADLSRAGNIVLCRHGNWNFPLISFTNLEPIPQ